MGFDFSTVDPDILFELTLGRIEGIAQRNVKIFVSLFVVMIATYDDVLVRNGEIDPDMIEITLMLMPMFGFHGDFAADDVVAELLQLRHFFANFGLDGIRVRKAPERNL